MNDKESKKENSFDEEGLRELRREIMMKKIERSEGYDPNFNHIVIRELKDEDFEILLKIRRGIITTEEFEEYREKIRELVRGSRMKFLTYLSNENQKLDFNDLKK